MAKRICARCGGQGECYCDHPELPPANVRAEVEAERARYEREAPLREARRRVAAGDMSGFRWLKEGEPPSAR